MVDNAFMEEPLPPDVEEIVHDVELELSILETLYMRNASRVHGKVMRPVYLTTRLHQPKTLRDTKIVTALTLQCLKKQFRNFTRDHGAQS
jgi:hypothetical protein